MRKAPNKALEFFERSHKPWFLCNATVLKSTPITITSYMFWLIWDELDLCFKHAMSGSYLSCTRSLRYIFQFAVEAALLERKYRHVSDGWSKVTKASKSKIFEGFRVDMLRQLKGHQIITPKEYTTLKQLYHKLSIGGTHAVGGFLLKLRIGAVLHDFDKGLFLQSNEFCREVIDLVLVVLFEKYPQLKKDSLLISNAKALGLTMAYARMP